MQYKIMQNTTALPSLIVILEFQSTTLYYNVTIIHTHYPFDTDSNMVSQLTANAQYNTSVLDNNVQRKGYAALRSWGTSVW